MKKITEIIVILIFIHCVLSDRVNYQDCGSEYDLDDVDIQGCNRTSACIFHPKDRRNINIKLQARDFTSKRFYQEVHLIFGTLFVPLTVIPGDLCTLVSCPVRLAQDASFTAIMDFSSLPPVQSAVTLHWIIYNENRKVVMCMEAKAKYENPRGINYY